MASSDLDKHLTIVDRVLFLMELDMFKSIQTDQVARIAARASEVHFDPGQVVYAEGQPADGLFLVVDGEVELSRGGIVFHHLARGAGFGLTAILGPEQSFDSTARARQHSHVLHLSREAFFDAVADHPEFARSMIRSLATTIVELTRRIGELEEQLGRAGAEQRSGTKTD